MRVLRGDWVVALAAALAFVARVPSLLWPLRPDEAGFILVARSWDAQPDSVYGHYFVDRAPQIIALMGLSDDLGGPYFHRLIGALLCVLLVVAAAAAGRELARWEGLTADVDVRRVARWSAVVAAALVSNAQIDAPAVKGEILGIPLVMTACWLALRAVRHHSWLEAFLGGMVAAAAVGMKQNLVGGLVFGGLIFIGAAISGRMSWRRFAGLSLAASLGAAVPVAATVAWAVNEGVRLQTLWYTVVAFRGEASTIIAAQDSSGAASRIGTLATVFVATGMAIIVLWFVIRLPWLGRHLPVPAVAITAMVAVDLVSVALSGSFWLPYLFAPVPALAMAVACVLVRDHEVLHLPAVPRMTRWVIGFAVVSSVISLGGWMERWVEGRVPVEARTGQALAAARGQGDTLVVYGGRADIQFYSQMRSPYPHLWSLPMRTTDPGLEDLAQVLTGRNPPTWVVLAARVGAWSELGTRPIERSLLAKYEFITSACDEYKVYRLNTTLPVELDVDCRSPWHDVLG